MSLSRNATGREFQRHGPATEKLRNHGYTDADIKISGENDSVYKIRFMKE